MPLFVYKAVDQSGLVVSEKIEKDDKIQVHEAVRQKDLILLDVKKLNILTKDLSDFEIFQTKFSRKDLGFFCRQLSFILNAGIVTGAAFQIMLEQNRLQAGNQKGNKNKSRMLRHICESLFKGESLWGSLQKEKCFPSFLIGMVQVGEESGRLPQTMSKMADYYENEARLSEEIKSTMLYPTVVASMMLLVIGIFLWVVAPSYVQMFVSAGVILPWPTRFLISMGGFFSDYWVAVLIVAALLILLIKVFLSSSSGKRFTDRMLLHTPGIRIPYRKMINLRFAETLGLLLSSGISLLKSMKYTSEVINNTVISEETGQIIRKISQGESLHEQLEQCVYFEPMLAAMVKIGEETGSMDESMSKCAEYLRKETDTLINRLGKLAEPAITILLGGLLAFVMLAVMLPAFTMTSVL